MAKKEYSLTRYILPSVISMLIVGTYTNIDGLFIGNTVGDNGLAAINFAWPIVAFITSIGMGIGIGGCVMLNNYSGKGDLKKAAVLRKGIIYLLTLAGLITGIVMFIVSKPFLILMGAEGKVLEFALQYSKIISAGSVFQVLGAGLIALLRNENKTVFAMFYTVAGLIIHVLIALIFVGKYNLSAVALATVISQAVVMALCLLHTKNKIKDKPDMKTVIEVLKASFSPFGLNFIPSVVLLLTNYFAIRTGSVAAVSAYAVMSYAMYTFDYIFQGVCDGIQPIISYYTGSKRYKERKSTLMKANILLGCISLIFIAGTPLLIKYMPIIFSVSDQAKEMMQTGFLLYAIAYPFKAAAKSICSYNYACENFKFANILIYCEPVIVMPVCLMVLTSILHVNGLWIAFALSQIIIVIIAGIMSLITSSREKISMAF